MRTHDSIENIKYGMSIFCMMVEIYARILNILVTLNPAAAHGDKASEHDGKHSVSKTFRL